MGCSAPSRRPLPGWVCGSGLQTDLSPPGSDRESQVGAATSGLNPRAVGRQSHGWQLRGCPWGTEGHRWHLSVATAPQAVQADRQWPRGGCCGAGWGSRRGGARAGPGGPQPTAWCGAAARFPWAAGSYISSLFSESKEVLSRPWRCDRRRNNLSHSSLTLPLGSGAVAFVDRDVKPNHFPAVNPPGEQVLEIAPSPPDLRKSSATEIKDNPAAASK